MALHTLYDYEKRAKELISMEGWEYYNFGRERKWCFHDSVNAFGRYRIRRRTLQDVSDRSLATTVLGQPIPFPIGISPTALQYFAHFDGEKATAIGAEATGSLMILSCGSSTPLDTITSSAPTGLRWLNMYPYTDRELTKWFIREAEKYGFKAIVVTVDSPAQGTDSAIGEMLGQGRVLDNPSNRKCLFDADIPSCNAMNVKVPKNHFQYVDNMLYNPKATWDYIRWMKQISSLPVVVKGILTAESAIDAVNAGVDGIMVSAHGGRQCDGDPAPIDALAEVADAVRGTGIEVYMDGGVRTGSDVFKALARGARVVFIGRPILWGLACQGAKGVRNVLHILRDELDTVLALSGNRSPASIPPGTVVHQSYYQNQPAARPTKSKL